MYFELQIKVNHSGDLPIYPLLLHLYSGQEPRNSTSPRGPNSGQGDGLDFVNYISALCVYMCKDVWAKMNKFL